MGNTVRETELGADVWGLPQVVSHPAGGVWEMWNNCDFWLLSILFSLILETDPLFSFWEANVFPTFSPFGSNRIDPPPYSFRSEHIIQA